VRNLWGVDGDNEGTVTVTLAELFACEGDVVWGNF
jgi:hypothetical protein